MSVEHIVSVSGGKDSTALYLLALERGRPFRAVFADTGNEHEWTYDFVRELPGRTGGPEIQWVRQDFTARIARKRQTVLTKWVKEGVPDDIIERTLNALHPTGNPFLDLCLLKGRFPSSKARFCTEELKVRPIGEQVYRPLIGKVRAIVAWQGVRAAESAARAMLAPWQRVAIREAPGARIYAYRPLLRWSIEQVWEAHERHGLPRNALYDSGMGRVGCMPCIMARKGEIRAIADRFPGHVERIRGWERLVSDASKLRVSTFFSVTDDPTYEGDEILLGSHGIDRRVEWSRTSDGKQLDMMLMADFNTACNTWGACE